jgi:hypothetical protein
MKIRIEIGDEIRLELPLPSVPARGTGTVEDVRPIVARILEAIGYLPGCGPSPASPMETPGHSARW